MDCITQTSHAFALSVSAAYRNKNLQSPPERSPAIPGDALDRAEVLVNAKCSWTNDFKRFGGAHDCHGSDSDLPPETSLSLM